MLNVVLIIFTVTAYLFLYGLYIFNPDFYPTNIKLNDDVQKKITPCGKYTERRIKTNAN